MKDKDILKIIKKDIDNNTPNIMSKINLADIDIKEEQAVIKKQRNYSIFNFKILVPLTSFIFIGILVFSFMYKRPIVIVNEDIKVTNKDKIVANYTTQALDLIDFNNSTLLSMTSNKDKYINDFDKNSILLQDYLNLIETTIKITQTSNKKHPYKMEVETKKFFGEISNYTLEYFEEREEDDDETEKKMIGIIIYQDEVFDFEVDQETDSEESEIEIIIKNKSGFYMEIEKEIELDEYSLEYVIKYGNKNYKKVSFEVKKDEMELEIETNNNKQKFEMTIIDELRYEIKIDDIFFILEIDKANKTFKYS